MLCFSYIGITDIQGEDWKKPRFRTHAKMRWDDKYLYIGAFLQETDVWANQTKHDSVGKYQTKINLGKIFNIIPKHPTGIHGLQISCTLNWVWQLMFWEKSFNFEKNQKKLQVDFWESYYVLYIMHICVNSLTLKMENTLNPYLIGSILFNQ